MTSKTKEETTQTSVEKDSSELEDTNFAGITLTKDQFKLLDSFRDEVNSAINYMCLMGVVTDGFEKFFLSGMSYHKDPKTEIQNSGWRYMAAYLRETKFLKSNQTEATMLGSIHEKLGCIEEEHFYDFFYVEHDSSVFVTSRNHLEDIKKVNYSVEKLLRICNRRRKKVERAMILRDLRAQCGKLSDTVVKLDMKLLQLSNLQRFVKNSGSFHCSHFQHGLSLIQDTILMRCDVIKEEFKKGQQEKNRSTKSKSQGKSKSVDRTVKDLKK